MKNKNLESLREIYKRYISSNIYFSLYGDKGSYHSYIEFYQEKLLPFRTHQVNLLEIGIYDGGSMAMFNEYFPNGKMYGIDISDEYINPLFKNIFTFSLGHQSNHHVYKNFPSFHIIIDDGSGKLKDQINTLRFLYFKLKFNGLYFIEDISDIKLAKNEINQLNKNYIFYDFREINNRFDNVILQVHKPINLYTIFLHVTSMLHYYKNIYIFKKDNILNESKKR